MRAPKLRRKPKSSEDGRISRFVKTSVLGILLFAVIQAVFGTVISDWVRSFFVAPELRLRYFLLEVDADRGPDDNPAYPFREDRLIKIFGPHTYIQHNIVFDTLRLID